MSRIIAAGLAAALCSCAGNLPSRGQALFKPKQFRLREFILPSGMRVVVEQDPAAPVVGVVTLVGVGSSSDPLRKEGLAHLVEHLAFRSRPDGDATVWQWLDGAGFAYRNAGTGLDTTTYFIFGARESLPTYLRIAGRQLAQPVANLAPGVLEVEREVVRNELRERNETGHAFQIVGWLQAAIFPAGHPYARPIGGTHESLNAITLDDAKAFAQQHYRPDNMTMIVFGDIELESADTLLTSNLPNALFGDASKPALEPGRRLPATIEEPPVPPSDETHRYQASIPTPELWIAWALPRSYEENSILQSFISASLSHELASAAVDDRDIAGVTVDVFPGTRASMLYLRAVLRSGDHWERSAQHLLNHLVDVWLPADRSSRANFGRMQVQALTSLALDAEDPQQHVRLRASLTHFTGDPTVYSKIVKLASEVEQSRFSEFAYKYLRRERARIVYVAPLDPEAQGRLKVTGLGTPMPSNQNPVRFAPPAPEMMKRMMRAPGASKFRSLRLDNGLELIIGRRPGTSVVSVGLAFHGGRANGSPLGVVELADLVVSRHSSRPDDYGIRLRHASAIDFSFTVEQAATGNVGNAMQILFDRLQSPEVIWRALSETRSRYLPYLRRVQQFPSEFGRLLFWRALYQGHPYGNRATAADMDRITDSNIESWIQNIERPPNAVLTVVGDIEAEEVVRLAQNSLGKWRSGEGAAPPLMRPLAPSTKEQREAKVSITHRPGATQAEILLGCLLPAADPRASIAYEVASGVLERQLFRSVRAGQGATYGLHPGAQVLRGGAAHLVVSGSIDNGQLAPGLKELQRSWNGLRLGNFDEADLQEVIWERANRYNLEYATSLRLVEEVLSRWNLGWQAATLDEYPADLASIRKTDIQQALANCPATQVLSIVGDEAIVAAAVKEGWR